MVSANAFHYYVVPRFIPDKASHASSCVLQNKDGCYTAVHMHQPRNADLFEDVCKDRLPNDDIFVPPQHQPINPEDEDDVVPDQHAAFGIQRATQSVHEPAWKDLGLAQLMRHGPGGGVSGPVLGAGAGMGTWTGDGGGTSAGTAGAGAGTGGGSTMGSSYPYYAYYYSYNANGIARNLAGADPSSPGGSNNTATSGPVRGQSRTGRLQRGLPR